MKNRVLNFLKRIALVAIFCLVGAFSFVLAGCDNATAYIAQTIIVGVGAPTEQTAGQEGSFYMDKTTFDLYIREATGWSILGTIKGEKGDPGLDGQPGANGQNGVNGHDGQDGDYIVFDIRTDGVYYKYSLEPNDSYRILTTFADIKGEDGEPVEIYVENGAIYWKYTSANSGTKIVDIADLVGSDGDEIELSTNDTYVLWKYKSEDDSAYRNLIRLSDISGVNGKSAYQIALDNNFVGTEEEWLASLKGEKGDDGDDGISVENISIRYEYDNDGNEWIFLTTEYSNGETKETSSPVPKKVVGVEMVTQVFAMQDEPGEMPTFRMVAYYEDGTSQELDVAENMILSNSVQITRVGVYHARIKYKGKYAESDFVVAKDFDMDSVVEYVCLDPINTLYGSLNKIILFSKNGENSSAVGVVNQRSLIVGDYSIQGNVLCLEGDFFGAPSYYVTSVDLETGLRVISTLNPAVEDETPETFVYKILEDGNIYSFNVQAYSNGYASISSLQGEVLRAQTVTWSYDNETGYITAFGKTFQIIDETSGLLLEVLAPTNDADYVLEPDSDFISSLTDKTLENAYIYLQDGIVKFVYDDGEVRTYEMIVSVENPNEFAVFDPMTSKVFYYVVDEQNNLLSNPNYTILTADTQSVYYNNLPAKIYLYQDGSAVLSIDGSARRGYTLTHIGGDNYYVSSNTDLTQNKYNSSLFITISDQTYCWLTTGEAADETYTYSYTQSSHNYQKVFLVYNNLFDNYSLTIINEYEDAVKISTRATTTYILDGKLYDNSGVYNIGAENVLTREGAPSSAEYTNREMFAIIVQGEVTSTVTDEKIIVGENEYPYTTHDDILICQINSKEYLLAITGETIEFYTPDTTDMDEYENEIENIHAYVFTFNSNLYALVTEDDELQYTIRVEQDGDNILVGSTLCTPVD